jgi:hypothetical protein|tara:strand:+ start:67 stop:471 length:405 start_codon:yes stop_codon:yes gene_type:complete
MKKQRKYLPTLNSLIDRLSIHQLKEVFLVENKENYSSEIQDIIHDIDMIIEDENIKFDGRTLRAIIVLAQMNTHIWYNESKVRKGDKDGNLHLTHGLNGIRNTAANIIADVNGERKDYKIDCLAAEFKDWEISW